MATKLLLGNQDYSAIRTYPKIIPYFFEASKLDILGMQKVLLNWDEQEDIRLNHQIDQLKYPETEEDEGIITIEGHHHIYKFIEQERKIYLPSLSNGSLRELSSTLYEKGLIFCPLFLIASKQDEKNQLFEVYCVDGKQKSTTLPSEKIEINTKTKKLTLYK